MGLTPNLPSRYRASRVGVAVSGGADSVFLLHTLKEMGVAAVVLHVNHRLRGEESDLDEQFVRALAEEMGLPVRVFPGGVSAGNIEQEARKKRYGFFAEELAAGTCEVVATGHTLDDQAETVLYRFLRGAGTAGLSGIRPETSAGIVRPLLGLRRDDIRKWLQDRNIHWREDRSNEMPEFARNRIRIELMPLLAQSMNPALPEVLATTAEWAQGEEDYWAAALDVLAPQHLGEYGDAILISTKGFLELPVAVQRRLLRRGIERVRGSLRAIGFGHVEAIRAMMATQDGSGRIQLPDLDIYRSFDWLRLAPVGIDTRLERDFESPLAVPGRTEVPGRGFAGRALTLEMELVSSSAVYNNDVQALDWERCAGIPPSVIMQLRNWRPGDHYQPQGRNAPEKIKTLFQEFRVPLWERRNWPVVVLAVPSDGAQGNEIVWARGFGVAERFAAKPESETILTIREVMEVEEESNRGSATSMLNKRTRDSHSRRQRKPGLASREGTL